MDRVRILLVGDQTASPELQRALAEAGCELACANDSAAALGLLETFSPGLILSEIHLPGSDGLELLAKARAAGSRARFIFLTSSTRVSDAVAAMHAGAENYLVKPIEPAAVLSSLREVLLRAPGPASETAAPAAQLKGVVGTAPGLLAAQELVRTAAPSVAPVLFVGESGTGKDLLARALHSLSPRSEGPFLKVSCATLTEVLLEAALFGHAGDAEQQAHTGLFEQARGGTLFLDEVSAISSSTQLKLLRALQEREIQRPGGGLPIPVDVRVVAATQRDLAVEVKARRFREDLFYRLNVVTIPVPALRQRTQDIPALAAHFLEQQAHAYDKPVRGLAADVMPALLAHRWPGNVRELESALEHAVVLSSDREIRLSDLPALASLAPETPGPAPVDSLHEIERQTILRALEMAGGSTARAAKLLGISVRKIQYRLKEYAERAGASHHREPLS